ncbi:MAG: folate family ECF transporter S component [Clostridia bacterium]|nr:folate family ECF transporter S component [Clostridia bacterium]
MKKTAKLYKFPIGAEYWKSALGELEDIRCLVICALLCAIAIVIETFQIAIIPNVLYISFSFVAISLCSFLTGPIMAIPCGIIVDIVGALINGYSFYFGYTLSAVLGALIYALFFYRAKVSFERIALARLLVNIFVNVLLGSLWRLAWTSKHYLTLVMLSGIKNILLFPFEVFIMVIFFRSILPPISRLGLCPPQTVSLSKTKLIITAAVAVAGMAALIYCTSKGLL